MDADMQIPVSRSTKSYPVRNFTLLPCFGLYAIYMENQIPILRIKLVAVGVKIKVNAVGVT